MKVYGYMDNKINHFLYEIDIIFSNNLKALLKLCKLKFTKIYV